MRKGAEDGIWDVLGQQNPSGGGPGEIRETCAHRQIMQLAPACGFAERLAPEKGGAVAGANSDKSPPPNQAGSEQVAPKSRSEMNRMPKYHGCHLVRQTTGGLYMVNRRVPA